MGKRRGRGAAARGGEGREREAHTQTEKRINEEILGTTMEVSHRGRRPSTEPMRSPSINGDSEFRSTNRTRPDEALDETNAAIIRFHKRWKFGSDSDFTIYKIQKCLEIHILCSKHYRCFQKFQKKIL
jgi:hypothetical protein